MNPLTMKRYPPSKASQLANDSSTVSGANVANALDALQAEISGITGSGVTTTDPTTVQAVPAWDTTGGHLRPDTNVGIDPAHDDKLLYWASVGAFDTAADGATITLNCDQSSQWQFTQGGDRTLAITAHTCSIGQRLLILGWQDGTGGRTLTWFPNVLWNNGLAPIPDPTPGGWNAVLLECIAVDAYGVPTFIELCRSTSAPRRGIQTLTDGATVNFDTRICPHGWETLGGNRTLAIQSKGLYVGQPLFLDLTQGTGGQTVTWWANIDCAGGVPTLSTGAGATDCFAFIVTGIGGSPTFRGFVIGQGL